MLASGSVCVGCFDKVSTAVCYVKGKKIMFVVRIGQVCTNKPMAVFSIHVCCL